MHQRTPNCELVILTFLYFGLIILAQSTPRAR